jgi:hypothetical protein
LEIFAFLDAQILIFLLTTRNLLVEGERNGRGTQLGSPTCCPMPSLLLRNCMRHPVPIVMTVRRSFMAQMNAGDKNPVDVNTNIIANRTAVSAKHNVLEPDPGVIADDPPDKYHHKLDNTVFYAFGDIALHGHGRTGVIGRGSFAGVHGVPIPTAGKPNEKGIGVLGVQGRGQLAGKFIGDVAVTGDLRFEIQPDTAKPPLKFHCIASLPGRANAAGFLEEFGEVDLPAGATLKIVFKTLHPDFASAATLLASNYQVFLTPCSDCKGLFVVDRAADGFTVKELQGGTNAVRFVYRIVAPRGSK